MSTMGVLEEIRPADLFTSDTGDLARPGKQNLALVSTSRPHRIVIEEEPLGDILRATAERDRDRAIQHADAHPSSTTFSTLAQAHAALNERDEAVSAALKAMSLGLHSVAAEESSDARNRLPASDPISVRISAEVLLRFGLAAEANELLGDVASDRGLSLTKAVLLGELGQATDALAAIEGHAGPIFEGFRGYVLATVGEYQKAIPHLRAALRDVPDDADSALNLSISLWHIGAFRKATAAALRATRMCPGRKDISLHFMELLLAQEELDRLAGEIRSLRAAGIVPDAEFLVMNARLLLAQGRSAKALPLLDEALKLVRHQGDRVSEGEIASNSVVIRHELGRISRSAMSVELTRLLGQFPDNDAVIVNFTRVADRRSHAGLLKAAYQRIEETTTPTRRAFLQHYIAFLEGDNEAAGSAALDWFECEPDNPQAAAGALVAIGIGLERWSEAEKIADFALSNLQADPILLNNAAYVLAMVGRAEESVRLLEHAAKTDEGFVLRATLGLAHLALGDVDLGMKYYREAAERAEKVSAEWSSLMTAYQALVVRQLGLDQPSQEGVLAALALAPCGLPSDWEDRPDFLRLKFVCDKNDYPWPISL
jgi:tetratricopeptide (TPR) repeat protein